MINHIIGLLIRPRNQWETISKLPDEKFTAYLAYPALLAILPAVAWFYGSTEIGWGIGDREGIRLTQESATSISIMFYITMLLSVVVLGALVNWMASTYGARTSLIKGIVIIGFTATPLFISGAIGFYPVFSLVLFLGMTAASYSLYLLYLGIPIVMDIPEERGFLFSSAVMAMCMVIVICILVATVILWDFVAMPIFTE